MKPNIRKQTVAQALAAQARQPVADSRYRGIGYSLIQEPAGAWRWKVQPGNSHLYFHEHTVATGYSPSREAAETAARAAIDAHSGC